ncbi:hypothetical protein B0H14DRAFT_3558974 [Mycena olivaceomarginata]|nr:hypothetical protein B0H14DRAFT_3558974 [Mycena olivaceomarginata]
MYRSLHAFLLLSISLVVAQSPEHAVTSLGRDLQTNIVFFPNSTSAVRYSHEERNLYVSHDRGRSWKREMSMPGNLVEDVVLHPFDGRMKCRTLARPWLGTARAMPVWPTITQAQSAPLVAVVGATGVQGGSVIKALSESEKPYRIRGFTRDLTKATTEALKKQGVEMIVVNLIPENKEEVCKAFAGADYTFEISQGKLLVDASKAAGVKGIVWSGLVPAQKISGGKYTKMEPFDGKALVTEYGRASGVPFVDVQAGFYTTNFLGSSMLAKQPDGTYALSFATKPTTIIPVIDMEMTMVCMFGGCLQMPVGVFYIESDGAVAGASYA